MAEIVTNEPDVFDQLNREPHVIITRKELDSLLEDRRWRQCVEGAGVDNWGQFHYAMEEFYGDED